MLKVKSIVEFAAALDCRRIKIAYGVNHWNHVNELRRGITLI